jgi:heme/copper-type cytochrome/quinol oxidase subunit 2
VVSLTWVFLGGCGLAAYNAWMVSRLKKKRANGEEVKEDSNHKIITSLDPVIMLLFKSVIAVSLIQGIYIICTRWIGWWFW